MSVSARRRFRTLLFFVGALVVIATFARALAPHDPEKPLDSITYKSHAPSAQFPFGTDKGSRDVLSRVLVGGQISLLISVGAVAIALLCGTAVGAIAAIYGGWVDTVLMRTLDVALSVPRLLILLAFTSIVATLDLLPLIALLGLTGWFDTARLVRGEVAALLKRDFVLAADAMGVARQRLFLHHVLPHLLPTLAVVGALSIANTIALEAGLSFLGFGVQPPVPSWGNILNDSGGILASTWWTMFFPGVAIVLTIWACNALGDALREAFAPEQVVT